MKDQNQNSVKIETKLWRKHVFAFYHKCDFGTSFMTGST
jgi:hypothetical protein